MNGVYNNFYLNAKVKFKYDKDTVIHGTIKTIQFSNHDQNDSQVYYLVQDSENKKYLLPQHKLSSQYEQIKDGDNSK